MAIEFRNMNQWIASSGLNQLFSAPTGIAIGAQPQTEKKGSAASWITTKTAQIALGAFTAMITAGVGYYTYKYFMGSESLLTGALPNNLGIDPNQHKPTDAPQSLIELSGDVMGPNMELSDERMVPFADAFTPRDGNASLTNQDEPLFQSFKAATPYMNNAWSYTISHVKPISTNNNYAVNIFPDVKHPVQDMDVVIDDDVTMTEDLPQPE